MGNSAYFRRITILCAVSCAGVCSSCHNSTSVSEPKGCTCVSDPIIKKLSGLKRREPPEFSVKCRIVDEVSSFSRQEFIPV